MIVNVRQKNWKNWRHWMITVVGQIGRIKVAREIAVVSWMMRGHTSTTEHGLSSIRMAPAHMEENQGLYFLIKAGFDNVNASTLRARLLASHIPSHMVDWVSSFLSERTCTLVFQGSPNISSPVSVGTPQGSPISPLLFLLYVAPLHASIPRGLMVSYVDDFSITVSSSS